MVNIRYIVFCNLLLFLSYSCKQQGPSQEQTNSPKVRKKLKASYISSDSNPIQNEILASKSSNAIQTNAITINNSAFKFLETTEHMIKDQDRGYYKKWVATNNPQFTWNDVNQFCNKPKEHNRSNQQGGPGTPLQISPYFVNNYNKVQKSMFTAKGRNITLIPNLSALGYYELLSLPENQLAEKLKMVDTFSIHGATFAVGHKLNSGKANFCSFANAKVYQKLRKLKKGIGIEVGMIKSDWQCSPAFGALAVVQAIERMRIVSGITPDYIYYDEPLKEDCSGHLTSKTKTNAFEIMADAFAEAHKYLKLRYPSIKFGLIEAYPGRDRAYQSDTCGRINSPSCVKPFKDITDWVRMLKKRGVVFDSFHIDINIGTQLYSEDIYKQDLKRFVNFFHNQKPRVRFGPIFWSNGSTQEKFFQEVNDHYYNLISKSVPDHAIDDFVFQNWSSRQNFSIPSLTKVVGRPGSQLSNLETIVMSSNRKRVKGAFAYNSNTNILSGWACFKNVNHKPRVEIIFGGDKSKNRYILGTKSTNNINIKNICGLGQSYIFQHRLSPADIIENNKRVMRVRVIIPSSVQRLALRSVKPLKKISLKDKFKGYANFNLLNTKRIIAGWACLDGVNLRPQLRVYSKSAINGSLILLKALRVNLAATPAIHNACKLKNSFRYSYKLTAAAFNAHQGRSIIVKGLIPGRGSVNLKNIGVNLIKKMPAVKPVASAKNFKGYANFNLLNTKRIVAGWACFQGVNHLPQLKLYSKSPKNGSLLLLKNLRVNLAATPAIHNVCKLKNSFRYSYQLTAAAFNAHKGRSIIVKGVIPSGGLVNLANIGHNLITLNTPLKPITIASAKNFNGYANFNLLNTKKIVAGWACFQGVNHLPKIHIYSKSPNGTLSLIKTLRVGLAAEEAVHNICKLKKNFRYSYQLTPSESNIHRGKPLLVKGLIPGGGLVNLSSIGMNIFNN